MPDLRNAASPISHSVLVGGGPVGFQVTNLQQPEAGPVIYVGTDSTTDAPWGRLSIVIANNQGDNTIIALGPSSLLTIYLDSLITDDEIGRITLAKGSSWTGGPVKDDLGVHLAFRPAGSLTILPNATTAIEIDHVFGGKVASGKFRFAYTGFSGVADGNNATPGFVSNRPGSSQQWPLVLGPVPRPEYPDAGDSYYVVSQDTPDIANYFEVKLYPSLVGALTAAPDVSLLISFMTDGDLALCSEDQLKNITAAAPADKNASNRWMDPVKITTGDVTVWAVQPTQNPGDLFPDNSPLVLQFSDVQSNMPVGGSAVMFVHCTGLSGFQDTIFDLMLTRKHPVPFVRDFHAERDGQFVPIGSEVEYGQLTLVWDVVGASSCLVGSADQAGVLVGVKGRMPAPSDSKALNFSIIPQIGATQYPQPTLEFRIAPITADIDATIVVFKGDANNSPSWDLVVNWTSHSVTACSVSHPVFGYLSDWHVGQWLKTAIPDYPPVPDLSQPFTLQASNPSASKTVQAFTVFKSAT